MLVAIESGTTNSSYAPGLTCMFQNGTHGVLIKGATLALKGAILSVHKCVILALNKGVVICT